MNEMRKIKWGLIFAYFIFPIVLTLSASYQLGRALGEPTHPYSKLTLGLGLLAVFMSYGFYIIIATIIRFFLINKKSNTNYARNFWMLRYDRFPRLVIRIFHETISLYYLGGTALYRNRIYRT
jgi:hypothetical protein